MYKANELVKDSTKAYDVYEFHTVFNAIHRFCTSDLSSKYLDVVKDRLYTLDAKNALRKSIQSTMYDILKIMTKLLAPILSFTAEEIWSYIRLSNSDAAESVLLTDMPKTDNKYEDNILVEKWDKIYELREEALSAIEKARAEKLVGHPLDAKVVFTLPEKEYNIFKDMDKILAMILIVSKVEVKQGERNITVVKAEGTKCDRCWKYNEHVGEDTEHPTICPECIGALNKMN